MESQDQKGPVLIHGGTGVIYFYYDSVALSEKLQVALFFRIICKPVSNLLGGNAPCNGAGGDILCHDTSCRNDRSFADGNAFQDSDIRADPNIIFDGHG